MCKQDKQVAELEDSLAKALEIIDGYQELCNNKDDYTHKLEIVLGVTVVLVFVLLLLSLALLTGTK